MSEKKRGGYTGSEDEMNEAPNKEANKEANEELEPAKIEVNIEEEGKDVQNQENRPYW